MSSHFVPLLFLALAAFAGAIRTRSRLLRIAQREERADTFMRLLVRFWESGGADARAFAEMTTMSAALQVEMGPYGVAAFYRLPGENHAYQNYQLIVNLLPEIRHWMRRRDSFMMMDPSLSMAEFLQDAVHRYSGVLQERREALEQRLRNPLALLAAGVRWGLSIPLEVLTSIGLLSEPTVAAFENGRLGRVVSGVVTLMGLVSAVVTLVLGWTQIVETVGSWFTHWR